MPRDNSSPSSSSSQPIPNERSTPPRPAPHSHRRQEAQGRGTQHSRRRFLGYGLAGAVVVVAAGAAGFELVNRGALPGKTLLDDVDGACSVPAPDLTSYATPGPEHSGTFYSAAR